MLRSTKTREPVANRLLAALPSKEYQRLRDQARLVMSIVGVETGGSNVQFAVDPQSGRVVVIEMSERADLARTWRGLGADVA